MYSNADSIDIQTAPTFGGDELDNNMKTLKNPSRTLPLVEIGVTLAILVLLVAILMPIFSQT